MKHTFKWFLMIGLSLMLSACITEYSPVDEVVQLESGQSQLFEAVSDNPRATLAWYLDGEKVAGDTNQYTFTAEENTTGTVIVHELIVKEEKNGSGNPGRAAKFLRMPSDLEDSVTWYIKVLPGGVVPGGCYLDEDGDGYGDPDQYVESDDPPENCIDDNTDCDDDNADVNPGATEDCSNEIDDNCDGNINEGCTETQTYYRDADEDGYGDPNDSVEGTEPPEGYVADNTDCDDTNPAVNPGVEEDCGTNVDDNCDGNINEGCTAPQTYYRDADGDGYGDPADSVEGTEPPEGYVADNTDCDDANAAVNPGVAEDCSTDIDDNCDGSINEGCTEPQTYYRDADEDGYGDPADSVEDTEQPEGYVTDNTDCDDANAAVNPGVAEDCSTDIDDNCDGSINEGCVEPQTYYRDADEDGYGDPADSVEDTEQPEGYVADNTDCDDANAAVNPGATEECDGIDNNCDGLTDDEDPDVTCETTLAPVENVSASDIDSGLTYIEVTWDASEGATYYNVYRAIWEEDAEYELVAENVTETTYDFVQTWQTDVYDIIGPNPAMAPDADVAAREAFTVALEAYREQALPVLFNFKAPAYFKVEACNDQGCAEMSDFDAGQAELIHTATESEVAQLVIPSWGYPMLKSLADSPPGVNALSWCGIDICGAVEGMLMGRLDVSGLPQVDVYYENYVEGYDVHPNALFSVSGYIGGAQGLIPSSQGVVEVSGEFDVSVGPVDAHLFAYSYIGGTTGNENDGYISITYNGETYQYTLPVQPVAGQDYADPPVPLDPARDDADYTIDRRETDYPVPFAEEPNTSCANWSDDMIVECNRAP